MIAFSRSDSERDRSCDLGTGSSVATTVGSSSVPDDELDEYAAGNCAGLIASKVQVLSNAPSREESSWSVGSDFDIGNFAAPRRCVPLRGARAICAQTRLSK